MRFFKNSHRTQTKGKRLNAFLSGGEFAFTSAWQIPVSTKNAGTPGTSDLCFLSAMCHMRGLRGEVKQVLRWQLSSKEPPITSGPVLFLLSTLRKSWTLIKNKNYRSWEWWGKERTMTAPVTGKTNCGLCSMHNLKDNLGLHLSFTKFTSQPHNSVKITWN